MREEREGRRRVVESGSLNQIFYGCAHSGRNRSHSVNNKCFIISTLGRVKEKAGVKGIEERKRRKRMHTFQVSISVLQLQR